MNAWSRHDLGPLAARGIDVWLTAATRDEALLRRLLARYVGTAAELLSIGVGTHGKPFIAHDSLRFNVSHSGEHTVVAIAHGCELGVDVEHVRRVRRRGALLERCFTEAERARIDGDDRLLLRYWSAKEALVKAIGRGIGYGLKRIEIDWDASGPRVLRVDGEAGPAARWRLASLPELDGGFGVVAYDGEARTLACARLAFAGTA